MKKIIRWLSEISGVAQEIRIESAITIGNRMQDYSSWFTGGMMHDKPIKEVANILHKYPEICLKQGNFNLFGGQFENLRSEIYKMQEKDEWIFDKSINNLIRAISN